MHVYIVTYHAPPSKRLSHKHFQSVYAQLYFLIISHNVNYIHTQYDSPPAYNVTTVNLTTRWYT